MNAIAARPEAMGKVSIIMFSGTADKFIPLGVVAQAAAAMGMQSTHVGSHSAPVVKYPPSRLNHWMKMMMAHIYRLSLRGVLEPTFDWYIARTAPEKLAARGFRQAKAKHLPAAK